jgi:hypothetical protein
MPTVRSSTFSSRTVALSDLFGAGAWQTLAVVMLLVGGAEAVTRLAIAPIGAYWEYWTPGAAAKFEQYRADVRKGTPPDLLIVGDSSAARDLDPRTLGAAAGNNSVFNLGWPANFPLAFRKSTLPLLRGATGPATVVVSFSPTGFVDSPRVRRFEESIIESHYADRDGRSAANLFYLARVRPALPFLRSWWTGRGLPISADRGFMPLDGMDQENAEDFAESGPFDAARFAVIEELFQTARDYGFQAIVLIPPRLDQAPSWRAAEQTYRTKLQGGAYPFLDYANEPRLQRDHFYDAGHLNRQGAQVFSAYVGEALRRFGSGKPRQKSDFRQISVSPLSGVAPNRPDSGAE